LPEEAAIDWKRPLDAIEAFADRSLIARKNEWDKKFSDTHGQKYESELQISTLLESKDHERDKKLEHQRRRNQVAVLGFGFASEELRRAWADLRADIGSRLEAGELIAKGIPAPYAAGKGEIEISAHEWRLLEKNPKQKTQTNEKGGRRTKELGVVIGKKQ
jgi:hypothetical protein